MALWGSKVESNGLNINLDMVSANSLTHGEIVSNRYLLMPWSLNCSIQHTHTKVWPPLLIGILGSGLWTNSYVGGQFPVESCMVHLSLRFHNAGVFHKVWLWRTCPCHSQSVAGLARTSSQMRPHGKPLTRWIGCRCNL